MRALLRLGVVIFIIALFIFLGVLVFGGHGKKAIPVTTKNLYEYADTDVDVRLTIDGQINGDDIHRQIVFTVGRDNRSLQVIKGYQGTVLKSENFGNNTQAYSAFLHALSQAGFTQSRTSKFPDEQGQCSLGQRYIYEVINNGNKNMRHWSTSCNGSGTFKGQTNLVIQLFQNQYANYSDYVGDVNL
ncbi:MAG: hypothetical protein ACXWLH_01645 [Candidatus Saccharimonadales bacterium]